VIEWSVIPVPITQQRRAEVARSKEVSRNQIVAMKRSSVFLLKYCGGFHN
jgi:hypothetical protein